MTTLKRLPIVVLVVMAAVSAGCGSSKKNNSSGSTATTASAQSGGSGGGLTIKGFAFPTQVFAKAGAQVSISNKDGTEHTVTADDGSFDVDVKGATATLTAPSKPGAYHFHCKIHSSMTSELVVS